MHDIHRILQEHSLLFSVNADYIEGLYLDYQEDPGSVGKQWQDYFSHLQQGDAAQTLELLKPAHQPITTGICQFTQGNDLACDSAEKQSQVLRLINAYRVRGHQQADIDPLYLRERPVIADLSLKYHQLDERDLNTSFNTGSLVGPKQQKLSEILQRLQDLYCGSLGLEYMHITDTIEKRWIQQRIETPDGRPAIRPETQKHILERLTAAEGLERYLHTRYVGQKRFSLEGAESLIPLLDEIILQAGTQTAKEVVIGMAHRGRLNVLINTLGKLPSTLFQEFEGKPGKKKLVGSGDVKYHKGFSADTQTPGGPVHVTLAFNPSHLEIIAPVVQGSVRARQQRRNDHHGNQVLPIAIHGDAAFSGQGVVMETLNMSQARGFTTGGTVHIVINNQIGFTTSNPLDTGSTFYCTDVAKTVQAPIFHVNGDDPEAVLFVTRLALDFRMEFNKDVVIDLLCYRRHGHNEADEPATTQPLMYKKIRAHATTLSIYAKKLIDAGVVTSQQTDAMREQYRSALEQEKGVSPHSVPGSIHAFPVDWDQYKGSHWDQDIDTHLPLKRLRELAQQLLKLPTGFELHPRVSNIIKERGKMAAGAVACDWGFAETMAYASLLADGYKIRLSGQDSGRGTFFHRHAVLHNQVDGKSYVPLQHVSEKQGRFIVIDSLLSEEAVLAFEYGYATTDPSSLTIWEAQFGDFANGAQVVIDQFISSGELKWGRMSGLVLMLPHGYEGQGAEHSSARLERYLQLCAEDNMQVCIPSTPAQIFHLLRRQMIRPYRKPLIIITPKSLLRHRLATSSLEQLSQQGFHNVIGDDQADVKNVKRIILCSGKVYYDLLEQREKQSLKQVAIIRIEQLYPFPEQQLKQELALYKKAKEIIWCQEEPQNQGAWYQIQHRFRLCLHNKQNLGYAGREASAAPAVGMFSLHIEQQQALIDAALKGPIQEVPS
ncbi:MAG: 2-oxoglutarate dehydrogenase E1 component [Gammaproteobacteria bacterium]|nr:2-oxoglutarate dehydrogenase E1 component [Gammaproteobacteria bacterium]